MSLASVTAPPQRRNDRQDDDQLLMRWRNGDRTAHELLVRRFTPLARSLARRYAHTSEPFEDLLQVASLGLLKALERFDPERQVPFAAFAVPTILGELRRYFRDSSWGVHVPRDLQERALAVGNAQEQLTSEHGRPPTVPELAQYLELPLEQILDALLAGQAYDALPLDAPTRSSKDEHDRITHLDTLGGEDERYELIELDATLVTALKQLPARERAIIRLRFIEELPQAEIGKRIGISQMQVSRLLRRSLEQLRLLTHAPPDDSEDWSEIAGRVLPYSPPIARGALAPPNIRLQLSPQAENIALIRTTLTGVAEAIDLPPQALDDVRTAVTEAANNVVLHAYQGDHHEGCLEVDTHIAPSALTVTVRDEGVGIAPQVSGRNGCGDGDKDGGILEPAEIDPPGSLKLGLPVITALASRVEFRMRPAGGTEVRMEFATPPGNDLRTEFELAAGEQSELLGQPEPLERSELIAGATIAIAPESLARTVLPRLLCALAARANFSTDRLSDAQLLADAIATQAFRSIIGEHLHVGIAVEPRQVELRVGPLPLPAGHSDEAIADSALGELAPVIQRLADGHSLAPAGPASMLALQLVDRR